MKKFKNICETVKKNTALYAKVTAIRDPEKKREKMKSNFTICNL